MAQKRNKTTIGTLTIALFWLILISGILLAIPFDLLNPYLAISKIMLANPWASFIRNFHYWSSQFFLVLTLIHLYDHFHYKEKIGLKVGMSIRLSAGVLIIFLAMLSGFLLKGDADSQQARLILESLTLRIPLIGEALAYSLLGETNSYLLIYVHHIATFTIFISIIIFEHSRKIWPPHRDIAISVIVVAIFSYFFNAPLHDSINSSVKGPWYFVGFQEILHWLKHPGWSLLLVSLLLLLVYLVNTGKQKSSHFSKRTLLVLSTFYLVLTLIGLFFRGEQWQWMVPGQDGYKYSVLYNFKTSRIDFVPDYKISDVSTSPDIFGRKESCIVCHKDTYGYVDAHKPESIGCFSCHGGNPVASLKNQAHKDMILIPGNLHSSKQSCGTTQCHPQIVERVPTGLMATLSGMISVNRTVFGEQDDPDLISHVHELGHSAADEHLKTLCVRCHLGNPKTEYGPVKEWSRGGGCLACHLNYSPTAEKALKQSRSGYVKAHPEVSLNVENKHCFGCHNRSGRIATNYEGWHETTLKPEEINIDKSYRIIEGRRVFEKQTPDVHHTLGIECIDCHHSYELMGDGNLYAHQEDQEDVQCSDCHFNGKASFVETEDLDNESAIIASSRFGNIAERKFLRTAKYQRPLINTFLQNDTAFMLGKNSKRLYTLSAPAKECVRTNAHARLSCSSCHSNWASSCMDCHNSYDESAIGYSMLTGEEIRGTWVENSGEFTAKLPALGIREHKNSSEIIPVIPGMVLSIDKKSYTKNSNDSTIFHRLFAPVAPHTTASKGRGCKTCHNNPVALGYGEGTLEYQINDSKGKWTFTASYENHPKDNLPKDAWIAFMGERPGMVSTRKNVSPFTVKQQKQILFIGTCLNCHGEKSDIMIESLYNFEGILSRKSEQCILPEW